MVVAFVATPLMHTLDFVFLTYSIPFGLSSGFFDCMSIITLREYFDRYLGFATGMRFASTALGAVVFNYLIPVFIDGIGWKKTFFALSSFGTLYVIYAMAYRTPISRKGAFDVISAKDQEIKAAADILGENTLSYGFLRNKGFSLFLTGNFLFVSVAMVPPMFMV